MGKNERQPPNITIAPSPQINKKNVVMLKYDNLFQVKIFYQMIDFFFYRYNY